MDEKNPMLRDEVNCEEINLHLYIFFFTFSFTNISYTHSPIRNIEISRMKIVYGFNLMRKGCTFLSI